MQIEVVYFFLLRATAILALRSFFFCSTGFETIPLALAEGFL
jgi:hypothetical protein